MQKPPVYLCWRCWHHAEPSPMQLALGLSLAPIPGASLLCQPRARRRAQPKALQSQSGEGRAAALRLSQPALGPAVVFRILGGSTSGGSCRRRNLFCFVPSFHALSLSPPHIDESRNLMSEFRKTWLNPNSTYSERGKCWTTFKGNGESSNYQYLVGSLSTLLLVCCSVLCLV